MFPLGHSFLQEGIVRSPKWLDSKSTYRISAFTAKFIECGIFQIDLSLSYCMTLRRIIISVQPAC